MSTHSLIGYGGYTPEELQVIVRRAHAERAKALRQMFAGLLAWRRKAAERRDAADAGLKTAACH
jgi:hypothetical protein